MHNYWTDGTGGVMGFTHSAAGPSRRLDAQQYQTAGPFDPYAAAQQMAAPFAGPGGGVAPGMRTPYGPSREWAPPPTQRNFLREATGFEHEWGEPPPLQGFRWNPDRYVYELDSRSSPAGPASDHYRRSEGRGMYLQPVRISTDTSLAPWKQWKLRQVHVPGPAPSLQEPYTVASTDSDDFFFKAPDHRSPAPAPTPEVQLPEVQRQWEGGPPVDQSYLNPAWQKQFGPNAPWTPEAKPGTYQTEDGRTVTIYAPDHWDKKAPTWEDYIRDPTFGGKRALGLGIDWYRTGPPSGGWKRDPVTGKLPEGYSAEAARAQRVRTLQERHGWGPQSVEALAKKQFERKKKNEAIAAEVARLEEEERERILREQRRGVFGIFPKDSEALPEFLKEKIPVPKVVGKDVKQAIWMLRNAGFREARRRVSSPEPEGRVIYRNPPGAVAPKGSTIELVISSGPG